MSVYIHPTAIVEDGAQLDDGVRVEAYAYVGAEVTLGAGTVVRHHATVEGYTFMGKNNTVHPYALIGGKTQDLKYKGGRPGLKIGDENSFREYATVHCATNDGDFTIVGSFNNLLAYSHIAHDCIIGDHLIASNGTAIAGHVQVGHHVVIGGFGGVHQFCRIGDFAMVGAMAKLTQDIPPYVIAEGNPAQSRTINKVGLERNGFDADMMAQVKTAFRIVYKQDLTREQALAKLKAEVAAGNKPVIEKFLAFFESSQRGVA
jgi:UDP-N-acetylglucosamine acyltransferase